MSKLIPLHSRKFLGLFAVVDDADYELVNQFKWCPAKRAKTFYAVTNIYEADGKHKMPYLHRLITGFNGEVDHISRDGLDCRRSNLRPASSSQNNQNQDRRGRTGFKGVWIARNRFSAFIGGSREGRTYLGMFDTAVEAARAYNEAALERYGEYALINEIPADLPLAA